MIKTSLVPSQYPHEKQQTYQNGMSLVKTHNILFLIGNIENMPRWEFRENKKSARKSIRGAFSA
jgi:hypothetical protein